MAPRRPSTADDARPSLIPFSAAEALLWGPELKKQNAYLLTEMRALQKQHDGYGVRIQTTEAVAEAAEAVTARVRHLEQQIAAIEAEDDEKAFEKWASGEIARLSLEDTNKNVRQKQIELDTEVSHISEDLERLQRMPLDLKGILRRLDDLEHSQRDDVHRIRSLEGEVERLRSQKPSGALRFGSSRSEQRPRQDPGRFLTLPQSMDAYISDATTETDDEEMLNSHILPRAEVQVPQSPQSRHEDFMTSLATSPGKDRSIISARQRLLRRPSIHDSMLTRSIEDQKPRQTLANKADPNLRRASPPTTQLVNRGRRHVAPVPAPEPVCKARSDRTNQTPPNKVHATQLVDRSVIKKRKQLEKEPQTQRQTRSQAKRNQAKDAELQVTTRSDAVQGVQSTLLTEPISSPRKKPKITPLEPPARKEAGSNTTSRTTGRSRKKLQKQPKEETNKLRTDTFVQLATATTKLKTVQATASRKKDTAPSMSRPRATSPNPQQRPIEKLPLPQDPVHLGPRDIDYSQSNAADRVKMSPRKAAAGSVSPLKVPLTSMSARNKHSQDKPGADTSGYTRDLNIIDDDRGSSSRAVSPEKGRPLARVRNSPAGNSTTGRKRRRAIPDIKDFDTFKRLQDAGALK